MARTLLWTVLWMLAFLTILGMSQAPVLTDNIRSVVTCSSEMRVYTCSSTSTRVQWIAEPFVNATGSTVLIPSGSSVSPAEFQDGAIRVEQISIPPDPFITSLTVSGKVAEETRVRCINAIDGVPSLEEFTYMLASVQSSTCNMVDIVSTNFSDGTATVRVGCQPSVSPEVTHMLNYTGRSITFDGTEARIGVSCDVGSLELRVCVSNRCGQESCGETETFPITCPDPPPCLCPSCVWCYVVLGIVGFILLVVLTLVVVHIGFVKCCKDKCCDCYIKCLEDTWCNCCCKKGEGESSISLEATGNDAVNKA